MRCDQCDDACPRRPGIGLRSAATLADPSFTNATPTNAPKPMNFFPHTAIDIALRAPLARRGSPEKAQALRGPLGPLLRRGAMPVPIGSKGPVPGPLARSDGNCTRHRGVAAQDALPGESQRPTRVQGRGPRPA